MVTENGKTVLYPMIDVCDDIRKFDKMISDLMKLVNDNMERKGDK